jgi:hypothetical protein
MIVVDPRSFIDGGNKICVSVAGMKTQPENYQRVSCCGLLFTIQGIISSGFFRCGLAVAVCGSMWP